MRHVTRLAMAILLVSAAACGGGGDDDDADAAVGDPSIPNLPTVNDGTCAVDVTGDLEAAWTGGGTAGDHLISYWLDDDQRQFYGEEFGLLLNCVNGGDMLTIMSGRNASEESVPMSPASYEVAPEELGDRLFAVRVTLSASQTNWGVTEPGGTIEFTRFDEDRIAGTFEFPMKDTLARFNEVDEGTITVAGAFDFPRN